MLSAFPHLNDAEFDEACCDVLQRFHRIRDRQTEWLSVEKECRHETACLSITKHLPDHARVPVDDDDELDHYHYQVLEDDAEVLQQAQLPKPTVHYDIVLSPVYRVPVLYISIVDSLHRYPPTMMTLQEQLVPPHFKAQTDSVGIIGGITIAHHPLTDRPVFFVHPCQTTEVMEASVGQRDITAEDYLLTWMGALGQSVGLRVPLLMVATPEA